MAELSLSAYHDKLDDQLRRESYFEVIAHARHILKRFPKNLRSYRQLARALFAEARWDEAASLLRRLLGALPRDFEAHQLLARCYQQLGQAERALWHAERALDQMPGDEAATAVLREQYQQHRGERIDSMRLSLGAQAQQQIRSNQLAPALEALAAGLEEQPQRLDWQLLRARALWLNGQRMDAAENAVDILERLPYAIDANRILTELWLAEKRPSDAQSFLRRIEELDPQLAHQLATGAPAPADLLMLQELDADSISQREQAIINPEWLNTLGGGADRADAGESGGLGALFGITEDGGAPAAATADLDGLLKDDRGETLFQPRALGETVAASSPLQAVAENAQKQPASAEQIDAQLAAAFDERAGADQEPGSGADAATNETLGIDEDMTSLLEELEASEQDMDWLDEDAAGASPAEEPVAGAPWLSAAMHEALDRDDSEWDLFSEDQRLQNLLKRSTDTEPLHQADIADWLDEAEADTQRESADTAEPVEDEHEHENEEEDDPYVDWLSDDLSAMAESGGEPPSGTQNNAADWGLRDPEQLADFLDDAAQADDGGGDWMNAVVPGLDRQHDADSSDPDEFTRPRSSRGKEFAWLKDIVDEETGTMPAVTAAAVAAPYFRFSKPPAWYSALKAAENGEGPLAALRPQRVEDSLESLDLDDLTFDNYFAFATPTDKMDAINLEDDTQQLDFVSLGWDDYFDLESPTEQTIAITLNEDAAPDFQALGVDDDDFDFENPASQWHTGTAAEDMYGFGDDAAEDERMPPAAEPPLWLRYRAEDDGADDNSRHRGPGASAV